MSTFSVLVVKLDKIGKHPNADTLSITTVEGCPCIFRTGDFEPGQLAVYIPVDAVVPKTVPGTDFLGEHRRIKAKRLRGIFSMGLLLHPRVLANGGGVGVDYTTNRIVAGNPLTDYFVGQDVSAVLGIIKYEEPEPVHFAGENVKGPTGINVPHYDVESYRKYHSVFQPGEQVAVTEKIHGTNSRFVFRDDTGLHVGSHTCWKDPEGETVWARVAKQYDLATKLKNAPNLVFYGETYGQVQDLRYGTGKGELKLAFFDIYDVKNGRWLDFEVFEEVCRNLGLPMVPVLYHADYDPECIDKLCDGESLASSVKQIREGFVIKPIKERWDNELGRVIAKLVGEEYLTRRGGTEYH